MKIYRGSRMRLQPRSKTFFIHEATSHVTTMKCAQRTKVHFSQNFLNIFKIFEVEKNLYHVTLTKRLFR